MSGQRGSMQMALERERKYTLPADGRLDVASLGPVSPTRRLRMIADYVDTPDLDLFRHEVVLRRRTGGDDDGWHLKTHSAAQGRLEHRMPGGTGGRVPAALREIVEPLLGGKPLLPVLRLRTRRRVTLLFDEAGHIRAELAVDRVRAVLLIPPYGRQEWSEVEVELAPEESAATFDLLEEALRDQGLTPAPHASKAGRILAGVHAGEASKDRTAAWAVRSAVTHQLGRLQQLEPAVLCDEPDAVHDTRVALRRLRSILGAFGPLVGSRSDIAALREELRWAGGQLSPARDLEVIGDLLADLAADARPAHAELAARVWSRHAEAKQEEARGRCASALATPRWDAMHARIAALAVSPEGESPRGRVPRLRRMAVAPLTKALRRQRRAEKHADDLERWHEVRKAAKAARYALELIADLPDAPDSDREAHDEWKTIAGTLGEVQDVSVARSTLAGLEADPEERTALKRFDSLLEARGRADLATARELLTQQAAGR